MRIEKRENDFEDVIIGAEGEDKFTIDGDSEVIFEILRDKMYSDKIGAVCREVASNSRDANREAGRGDSPVIIAIYEPTPDSELFASGLLSDTSISFEDEGPGITPDRMANVFLKYGASTKRETNAQTGGFGLGAKTPFAYSDTFTILTICNVEGKRMRYVYTAIIDSTGKGKMVLFESEEIADETPTGTKIIVPIRQADRAEFERKTFAATRLWNLPPIFKGFARKENPVNRVFNHESKDGLSDFFVIEAHESINSQWMALIDGIAYPINENQLPQRTKGLGDRFIICLPFNNGELTISANREQMQYDDSTKKKLVGKMENVPNVLQDHLKEIFNQSQKTFIETILFKKSLSSGDTFESAINQHHLERHTFSMKGKRIPHQFAIPTLQAFRVSRGYDNKIEYFPTESFSSTWTLPVYFMDTNKRDRRRALSILTTQAEFILLVENPIKTATDEVIEKKMDFVNNWGLDLQLLSSAERIEIEKDDIVPSYYQKREDVLVKAKRAYPDCLSFTLKYIRSTETIENGKDYVYVSVPSLVGSCEIENKKIYQQAAIISKVAQKKVIFVNTKSTANYMKNMVSLGEFWPQFLIDYNKEIQDIVNSEDLIKLQKVFSQTEDVIEIVGEIDITRPILRLRKQYSDKKQSSLFIQFSEIQKELPKSQLEGRLLEIEKMKESLHQRFPLLSLILENISTWDEPKVKREKIKKGSSYVQLCLQQEEKKYHSLGYRKRKRNPFKIKLRRL